MNFIHLFSCCVPVKGASQSIICDLQRRSYQFIPNSLFEILANLKIENSYEILMQEFVEEDLDIFKSYIDFLDENEFIFISKTKNEILEDINLDEFDSPSFITNSIIDYDYSYDLDLLNNVINQLDFFRCQSVELRFFKLKSKETIFEVLNKFNKTGIRSISITMPFLEGMDKEYFEILSSNQARVREISLFNVFDNNLNYLENSLYPIYILEENFINEKKCGFITDQTFYINIQNFTESRTNNSCLNKKLSIDKKGNIKNCPSLPESFGSIINSSIEKAIRHDDFKKYWNITKDEVEICKDCEFRYICTDCRAYLDDPENEKSKPLKCGYSPYTNVWEEWSTNELKQKAIKFYGL